MASYNWPAADKRTLIGARVNRSDGPQKATGVAKYAYDINRPGMLYAKLVTSPHAKAEVVSIDLTAAAAAPGVKATWKDDRFGASENIEYAGRIVAAVAAETEELATEAARLVKVEYKPQAHQVVDDDPSLFTGQPSNRNQGDVEDALKKADAVVEGVYGLPCITHCCLEPHGQVAEMRDDELFVWPSTQAVSGYAQGFVAPSPIAQDKLQLTQNKVHVDCQYMGGGFGSKFNADDWGIIGALLSKQAGRPVKLMLERDVELMIAGNRPSAYAKIKAGATKDGKITAMDIEYWGTGGVTGGIPAAQTLPYVLGVPHFRVVGKRISTNRGGQRAWRAPSHPQNCFLTMSACADVAAKLGMDELEFFLKNVETTARPQVYADELKIAADLIGYKQKAHSRGDPRPGPIKRGLGMSIHTWGGMGHASNCDVTIHPDGSVDVKIGTQDLGVGTRTVLAQVVGDTLGLPLEAIKVNIGRNEYPTSGGSGGSTTIGGVSVSSRKGAIDALNALFEVAAPKLGVQPDQLEARNGRIQQIDTPGKGMSWKEACVTMGTTSITKRGVNPQGGGPNVQLGLLSQGVGGVQMADVSVDTETGIVTMNEMVGVQDVGLVINMKLAESQVFGAMIMGITWALYEESIYDAKTGKMLNADMEFYRLAGIKDVGQLKVHMMTGKGYDERGVIGIGEPPAVSPGAAISNAVANAIGVRVPHLPLTPDRVLNALAQKGGTRA